MVERRQVSLFRKLVFYAGYLSMAGAIFLFVHAVVQTFEILDDFKSSSPGELLREGLFILVGILLIFLGKFLRRIGIRGLAGSVLILDPPRARDDLEPWGRAAGGLVDAAISEIKAVKAPCQSCGALNEEKARYCNQCGVELHPG